MFTLTEAVEYIQEARQSAHVGACPGGTFPCIACVPFRSAAAVLDMLLEANGVASAVQPARLYLHDRVCASGCQGVDRDEHARRHAGTVRELRRFVNARRGGVGVTDWLHGDSPRPGRPAHPGAATSALVRELTRQVDRPAQRALKSGEQPTTSEGDHHEPPSEAAPHPGTTPGHPGTAPVQRDHAPHHPQGPADRTAPRPA